MIRQEAGMRPRSLRPCLQVGPDGSISCRCNLCQQWDQFVSGELPGASDWKRYEVLTQELVEGLAHHIRQGVRSHQTFLHAQKLHPGVLSAAFSPLIVLQGKILCSMQLVNHAARYPSHQQTCPAGRLASSGAVLAQSKCWRLGLEMAGCRITCDFSSESTSSSRPAFSSSMAAIVLVAAAQQFLVPTLMSLPQTQELRSCNSTPPTGELQGALF